MVSLQLLPTFENCRMLPVYITCTAILICACTELSTSFNATPKYTLTVHQIPENGDTASFSSAIEQRHSIADSPIND